MNDTPPKPEDCQTMTDVRAGVDALDRELVALLATRFGYMRAAARIKPSRDAVRDVNGDPVFDGSGNPVFTPAAGQIQ